MQISFAQSFDDLELAVRKRFAVDRTFSLIGFFANSHQYCPGSPQEEAIWNLITDPETVSDLEAHITKVVKCCGDNGYVLGLLYAALRRSYERACVGEADQLARTKIMTARADRKQA